MGGTVSYFKDELFGVIHEETPKYEQVHKTDTFEIRQYGPAIVAETTYEGAHGSGKSTSDAFWALAGYIGAVSAPKNVKAGAGEGDTPASSEAIAMTSPVVMQGVGESIEMTAPVIMGEKKGEGELESKGESTSAPASTSEGDLFLRVMRTYMEYTDTTKGKEKSPMSMQFILPFKYTMETVPKPVDPRVTVKEVPGKKVGATVFNGSWSEELYKEKAEKLKAELEAAGHKTKGAYMFAGYNSPMTLPWYRRNEIWYELEG